LQEKGGSYPSEGRAGIGTKVRGVKGTSSLEGRKKKASKWLERAVPPGKKKGGTSSAFSSLQKGIPLRGDGEKRVIYIRKNPSLARKEKRREQFAPSGRKNRKSAVSERGDASKKGKKPTFSSYPLKVRYSTKRKKGYPRTRSLGKRKGKRPVMLGAHHRGNMQEKRRKRSPAWGSGRKLLLLQEKIPVPSGPFFTKKMFRPPRGG